MGGSATQLEDGGSVSSGDNDDEPLTCGQTHLGTDLLVGSYLMLFSALIFYAIMVRRIDLCLFPFLENGIS